MSEIGGARRSLGLLFLYGACHRKRTRRCSDALWDRPLVGRVLPGTNGSRSPRLRLSRHARIRPRPAAARLLVAPNGQGGSPAARRCDLGRLAHLCFGAAASRYHARDSGPALRTNSSVGNPVHHTRRGELHTSYLLRSRHAHGRNKRGHTCGRLDREGANHSRWMFVPRSAPIEAED
jgi:hypothetical protein